MISNLKLKFGSSRDAPAISINVTPVTIFVGPNNSGKSIALDEIEQYCHIGNEAIGSLILKEMIFSKSTEEETNQIIERIKLTPQKGELIAENENIIIGNLHHRLQCNFKVLKKIIQNPSDNVEYFCDHFLTILLMKIGGSNRVKLVNDQSGGDLQKSAESSLQKLFRDQSKRNELRRITFEALGWYFVLDPTHLGQLRIKLSRKIPNDLEEIGIHSEAIAFHKNAKLIHEFSDGIKAFVGIITEVIAGDPQVLFIDEPEAFLHPPLAAKLGSEIATAAFKEDKRVFVATHSSQFLMGCIESGTPLNIIRLTYKSDIATARILSSDEILHLMRHPLLRSAGLLNGLFYDFVVITEGDSDRAFYQEINQRLLKFKPSWGISNCLFINAQNKHTVHKLMNPLRKLGIPTVCIVDIDALKEGGTNWSNLLGGANIPEISSHGYANTRASLKNAMEATGFDMKKDGGIKILKEQDQQSANDLLKALSEYGIFIVPGGELESWLSELNALYKKTDWLIDIFEKMGEDPNKESYLKPSENDVWKFMFQIKEWLVNPNRKGIPI